MSARRRLAGTIRRPRSTWAVEAGILVALYLAGELTRGIARGDAEVAERHAADVVRLERALHVFLEPSVQNAAHRVWALPTLLGYAYLTIHLAVTVGVLAWLYGRRRSAYRTLRNALVLANGIAVAAYALYPTAPPRLAHLGVVDTVSHATAFDLGSAFADRMYNPYAAMPSMHVGFAVLVGGAVWRVARGRLWRLAGAAYPLLVLFVVVATGNHFLLDAAAGTVAAVVAAVAAAPTLRPVPVPAQEFG